MKSFFVIVIFLFGNIFPFAGAAICSASVEPFPHYPSLAKNVEFWKKVYTKYPSSKGYVHDSYDLSIIYDVVDLIDTEESGVREINRKRIKKAKKKYTSILLHLAAGNRAESSDEKKVMSLWGKSVSLQELKEAADNVRFQHCIRDKFREGLERSGRHMNDILTIFQKKGLPEDLVFLPHVESSFNYNAYSKFGAAGIWQFIRSTGKRFLTINYTVDERRDPILATHAAASYLEENYQKLGSWPLALTAYNHGANGMLRAQKQCGDFESILCDYKGRSFGFASRNFYAQFLAAREIAQNYQKHFKNIQIEPALQAQTVQLPGYVALDDLLRHFNVEATDIRSLNPALRRPIYIGQKYIPKGYELRLPLTTKKADVVASIPANIIKKSQKRSKFYRVGRGDTAGKIASMHKVTLQDLMSSNNLDKRARILVGQNLVIPGPKEVLKNKQLASLTQQASKLRPVAYVKKIDKNVDTSFVKTLSANSNKKNMQKSGLKLVAQHLEEKNPKEIVLESGDAKKIPEPDSKPLEQVKTSQKAVAEVEAISSQSLGGTAVILGDFQVEQTAGKGETQVGSIHVEAWETLSHYAEWLEVNTSEIRSLNKLKSGRPIKARQKIKIPLIKVSKDLFEERRYEFHKGIEEDFFEAFRVVETQMYTVKRGDTVWAICHEELGLPFWLIKKYNTLIPFDKLRPNQVLVVPVVVKTG